MLVYRSDADVAAKQITETMGCMPDITIESSASEKAIQIAMIVSCSVTCDVEPKLEQHKLLMFTSSLVFGFSE